MSVVSAADLATWRDAIGRSTSRNLRLDSESLRRFAVATGGDGDLSAGHPPLAHWAWFLEAVADGLLGEDGHVRPGGFLPQIDGLPRRMFASATINFEMPLLLDAEAGMELQILDVRCKTGNTGDLVFVDLRRTLTQRARVRVVERQTLVYRAVGEAAPPPLPVPASDAADVPVDSELWQPDSASLFRFSAATFNSHRIHYDYPYATSVEGYPALVIHGPFIAARLAALAARNGPLASFEFRAQAPLFADQPIRLMGQGGGAFHAVRCDGVISTIAKARYK